MKSIKGRCTKMIKIYEYGSVKNEEIFSRVDVKTGVEDVVADII